MQSTQQKKKGCNKTSLLFNSHRLSTTTKKNKVSVVEAFKDEKFISGLARAVIFNAKNKDSISNLLNHSFEIGINGVQFVNEFHPYTAQKICLKYGMHKKSKILDPCAGWGGRMIGCSTISDSYVCYEPVSRTYRGLKKINKFIQSLNPSFNAIINNEPFEDSELDENNFDLALTSPPYYDTEKYSNEKLDSANRYSSFEEWCDRFYFVLIDKTMSYIKPGSVFILNIGSRVYPLNDLLMRKYKKDYKIEKDSVSTFLSPNKGGLRSSLKEGEMFYAIQKPK